MDVDFVTAVYRGKTIGRILFNRSVRAHRQLMRGVTLDVAGGVSPSYGRYLPPDIVLTRTDYREGPGIDRVVDLNAPLPFPSSSFDTVLFFNALYILEDPVTTLMELRRILRTEGTLLLSSPFIGNEMPEPHDYERWTEEGLTRLLNRAGFQQVSIRRYGERFTAAANLLHPMWIFDTVRLIAYSISLALDRCIPAVLRRLHPAPLGFFCVARP